MQRRHFLKTLAASGVAAAAVTQVIGKQSAQHSKTCASVQSPIPVKSDPRTQPFSPSAH